MAEFRLDKNPLNKILGSILKKQRLSKGFTYKDMDAYGISESYMRGLEVGAFTLHVSKAIHLYQFLNHETEGQDFRLDGLVQYLSLVSILETLARDDKEPKKLLGVRMKDAAEEISHTNNKYKILLQPFIEEDVFLKDIDIEQGYHHLESHVRNFLVKYDSFDFTPSKKRRKYINESFNKIPSVYSGLINDLAEKLETLPVRIHFTDVVKWEKQHENNFASLNVLLKGKYDPTNEQEITSFSYAYLWNENFEKLNFFIVGRNGIAEMETRFSENLHKQYSLNTKEHENILNNWQYGMGKVKFEQIKDTAEVKELLAAKNDELDQSDSYHAFWVFKFIDDSYVGFLAEEKKHPKKAKPILEQGRSILFEELDNYLDKADKIFNL
jgi:hypothetical protein